MLLRCARVPGQSPTQCCAARGSKIRRSANTMGGAPSMAGAELFVDSDTRDILLSRDMNLVRVEANG